MHYYWAQIKFNEKNFKNDLKNQKYYKMKKTYHYKNFKG